MIRIPSQDDIKETKNIWQAICWRMNERKISPEKLAPLTGYSKDRIERGIKGEPIPITDGFIHRCVEAFGLLRGRGVTVDTLSYDKCVELIKPRPAMPPRQGNFWEYPD